MSYAFPPLDPPTIPAGSSVLFVAGDRATATEEAFDALAASGDRGVVAISTRSGNRAAQDLRERGVDPDALAAVDASGSGTEPDGVAGGAAVEGPAALSSLGIEASDQLERLGHRYDRVGVGLDSATDLVEAASLPGAFRFLHVLTGRVRTADAILVTTIEASAHDEEDRRTIAELFDEVIVDGSLPADAMNPTEAEEDD